MKKIESHLIFGGSQEVWQHHSEVLHCDMNFAIFLPSQVKNKKLPVVYFLSGLTCSEQNVITKSGFQQYAEQHGLIVVAPDTSPRGENVANDENYDLGQGAGFYLNATQAPWNAHFHMYDYIVNELPACIDAHFPTNGKQGIFGHSMGGLGALVLALRNPAKFQSVSAFSPIVSPSTVPWGQKAFTAYLGEDKNTWLSHDPVQLILQGKTAKDILIDQGLADPFFEEQLQTDLMLKACEKMGQKANIRLHEGYDHSYYFIATFMPEHMAFHAKQLNG